MIIEAECSVSERDYVLAHFVHMRPRPALKAVGWLLVILYVGAGALTAWRTRASGPWNAELWMILAPGVYLTIRLLVIEPWRLRRLYRQHARPGGSFRLTAHPDRAEVSSVNGHVSIPWTDFRKWKEGKTVFLLYHTDVLFHILPKSAFDSSQQDALRELLSQRLQRVA